jgi:hypothetical protein
VQRRADLAVERLGVDLRVDGDRLVLAGQRALRRRSRSAQPLDSAPERSLELLAVALDDEDVADPDIPSALRRGDAEGPALRRLSRRREKAKDDRGEGGLPYPYTPLSPGQHTLAITSATALTVPAGARFANVCATTAAVRYTTDGTTTPTSTVGQPLATAACVSLSGAQMIANFRAISATGTLDVEYFQ